uniref:Indolethylamine N-methyltransferase-like n=1 Tax=Geotrypetes seraphini TaxID=260995 RepID=A0A6P8NVY7_GEOSA|nr:indolethylamine N-methyltransferase-like [Geotrypetes seraphini]
MTSSFTDKNEYLKYFQARDYLGTYYTFDSCDVSENRLLTFTLEKLHQTFSSGNITGDILIDIGTGPTIYQLLSACECFREVIATDYMDRNRQELEIWLKKESGAFDWRPVVKFVCELEGDSEKWREKEETLRRKVTQVLPCDVTKKNPLDPLVLPQADCLLTFLCLEAASKDLDTYGQAVKNITSMVKPGGHLVLLVVLKETYYMVGQHKFSCLYLEKQHVEKAIEEAGCSVEHLELFPNLEKDTCALADYDAALYLVARKTDP